jgi:hypothetical protein
MPAVGGAVVVVVVVMVATPTLAARERFLMGCFVAVMGAPKTTPLPIGAGDGGEDMLLLIKSLLMLWWAAMEYPFVSEEAGEYCD